MIKLAIDAMGNDKGSEIIVAAIKKFLKDYDDVSFVVSGRKEELTDLEGLVEIIEANDIMGQEDGALEVMRKKGTSMIKAIESAKREDVMGVVSAGSTGAFLTASTIHLKLIDGVSRAALLSPFPTRTGDSVILLDIGANNENNAEQLLQFAKMGNIFTKIYKNISTPRLYLLSNGAEEKKGSPEVMEAHQLIKKSNLDNFLGNIEAREVLMGGADVVVSSGFPGNIFLKGTEGTAQLMMELLKDAFKKNIFTKIGYLFAKSGLKDMIKVMDYKNYGGAMLVGVNKVVVKGHGSSDERAFYNAIRVAYELSKQDMVTKLREQLK